MKIKQFYDDGEPKQYLDDYSYAEQKLLMLMGGVNGNYKTDYQGVEKTQSIRFTAGTYPKVKALAELSGNSINSVVNDLVDVAYGAIMENLSEDDSNKLFDKECKIRSEFFDFVPKVKGDK